MIRIPTLMMSLLLLCVPTAAMAQHVVALFTPGLDFSDGAKRNEFVNKVAKSLSEKTGMAWEGQAFARASDFESARSSISLAILDADYFSTKAGNLKPVAMLSANGQTRRPMKVIAKSGNGGKLYNYRNKRFAIVSTTSMTSSFITASALGGEIKAASYFASLDEVRDVRAAINAVDMGKDDLTLVFDGYDSGFTTVYTTQAVGLPVVAMNPALLSGIDADLVRNAAQNISARTSFITGTAPYNASDVSAFKSIAGSHKSSTLPYQPIESSDNTKIGLSVTPLKERGEGIVINPFQVQYFPTITEFDRKLEERL